MTRLPAFIAATAAVGGALALASAGQAQTGSYTFRSVTEPARPGLTVTGPLSEFVATARGRVLIPNSWRRTDAPAGRLRLRNTQNASCRFVITYRVRSRLAPAQEASEYVTSALPAASARHLLDSGEHGGSAWRVVRQATPGGVRVDAVWSRILTRRSDIAPAGQVVWSDILVTATSTAGSECHSGTYRQALGPTIGDSLAVARSTLRFTRKR